VRLCTCSSPVVSRLGRQAKLAACGLPRQHTVPCRTPQARRGRYGACDRPPRCRILWSRPRWRQAVRRRRRPYCASHFSRRGRGCQEASCNDGEGPRRVFQLAGCDRSWSLESVVGGLSVGWMKSRAPLADERARPFGPSTPLRVVPSNVEGRLAGARSLRRSSGSREQGRGARHSGMRPRHRRPAVGSAMPRRL
jgi:hypothetical protein